MQEHLTPDKIQEYMTMAVEYAILLFKAGIVSVVGLKLINLGEKFMTKGFKHKRIEPSLRYFLINFIVGFLKVALAISVIGMLGIKTTSFVAMFGAGGLAVGMSLQGALGNLAGGVLILYFKPFKVGHYITAQGHSGTVQTIGTFATTLLSIDNKTIVLPNGNLSSSAITNYSEEKLRRVDLTFGISYGDDIRKAKDILSQVCEAHSKTLKAPAPMIVVLSLGDSSVNLGLRPWVKTEDYWDVYFDLMEEVKIAFDQNSITIPFPQRALHISGQHLAIAGNESESAVLEQH